MDQNVQIQRAMLLQPHDNLAIDIPGEGCLKIAARMGTSKIVLQVAKNDLLGAAEFRFP